MAKRRFNIIYIRAAIECNTGVRLSIKEVAKYLLLEGMISYDEANRAVFDGYDKYHNSYDTKPLNLIVPVDLQLNYWEPIEKELE